MITNVATKREIIWSVKESITALTTSTIKNLPFVHAFLGCDTTSRIQGLGKSISLKKIQSCEEFAKLAEKFSKPDMTPDDIVCAGEKALILLYNAKDSESLNSLRYRKFIDKTSVKLSQVDPSALPPTSSAFKYHSLRVYLQVQQWIIRECVLKPDHWGWSLVGGKYIPIEMDIPPAPEELLKIIRCTCKGDCSNRMCTCKKYSRECTIACLNCRGSACSNSFPVEDEDLSGED